MDSLPPVRIPFSGYWREFRVRVLPYLVFVVVLGAVFFLWARVGSGRSTMGLGEGIRSSVVSPQPGVLQELRVAPFQMVEAGQVLAVVQPRDPQAQLDLLQTELQLLRMRNEPTVAEGNAMNFERIRVELLRNKSELAIAKVNLERTENEVRRNQPLFTEGLLSEDLYDLSQKTRDLYAVEVQAKSNAVAAIEQRLGELRSLGEPLLSSSETPTTNAALDRLDLLQSALATNWAPLHLVAPIGGMVTTIVRQPGEHVLEGEPVITINSLWSERIVGYLRQPYPVEPKIGLEVTVRTRERRRQEFPSHILQVGSQLEIITNALAMVQQGVLVDSGLPIVVELPPHIQIRPGEMVELLIHPREETNGRPLAARKESIP